MSEIQREPAMQLARQLSTIPAINDLLKRWIKEGKFPTVTKIDAAWINDRIKSKDLMNAELLNVLDIARANMPEERYITLVRPYVEALKTIHGQQLDINVTQRVMIEDIRDFFGQEDKIIDIEAKDVD